MAWHNPPLKKVKKRGEMPLPSLGPIPLKECRIYKDKPRLLCCSKWCRVRTSQNCS